jgi:hypothetical protein
MMDERRFSIRLGAPVDALDGPVGRVRQLVVSLFLRDLDAIVVRSGVLPSHDFIVPIEQVMEASDRGVRLRVCRSVLEHQPAKAPEFEPAADARGQPAGAALAAIHGGAGDSAAGAMSLTHMGAIARIIRLRKHAFITITVPRVQRVWCTDGPIGRLVRLITTPGGRVRALVLRSGYLRRREHIVPVAWVGHVDEGSVGLTVTRAAIAGLPADRPRAAIAAV